MMSENPLFIMAFFLYKLNFSSYKPLFKRLIPRTNSHVAIALSGISGCAAFRDDKHMVGLDV